MTISQQLTVTRTLHGDGISNILYLDLTNEIAFSSILPKIPREVHNWTSSMTTPITNCTISGYTVTVTFSGIVPLNDSGNFTITLHF